MADGGQMELFEIMTNAPFFRRRTKGLKVYLWIGKNNDTVSLPQWGQCRQLKDLTKRFVYCIDLDSVSLPQWGKVPSLRGG